MTLFEFVLYLEEDKEEYFAEKVFIFNKIENADPEIIWNILYDKNLYKFKASYLFDYYSKYLIRCNPKLAESIIVKHLYDEYALAGFHFSSSKMNKFLFKIIDRYINKKVIKNIGNFLCLDSFLRIKTGFPVIKYILKDKINNFDLSLSTSIDKAIKYINNAMFIINDNKFICNKLFEDTISLNLELIENTEDYIKFKINFQTCDIDMERKVEKLNNKYKNFEKSIKKLNVYKNNPLLLQLRDRGFDIFKVK